MAHRAIATNRKKGNFIVKDRPKEGGDTMIVRDRPKQTMIVKDRPKEEKKNAKKSLVERLMERARRLRKKS